MAFQTVFKRYELKYMLTTEQKKKVLAAMKPYMQLDKYGTAYRTLIFPKNHTTNQFNTPEAVTNA